MPVTAAPYLGQELAPALFEPRELARAESDGRLPVRIAYSAALPALPGVTITYSGGGTARGYLTAGGARRLGAALARQYAADHASASYGHDGMLRSVDITVAGAPAPARVARPACPMHTLIVSGTDLSGSPDTGDTISVFNVDDPVRFGAGLSDAASSTTGPPGSVSRLTTTTLWRTSAVLNNSRISQMGLQPGSHDVFAGSVLADRVLWRQA